MKKAPNRKSGSPENDLQRQYVRDWQEGPEGDAGAAAGLFQLEALHDRRALGNTCQSALASGAMGTRETRINDSKGCGGVMRAAPAGLVKADDAFSLGCDVVALTHSHPTGFLSAGYLALLIDRVARGDELMEAVTTALARLESVPENEETSRAVRGALDLAREGEPSPEKVQRLGRGWVAEEALAIALYYALSHADDLEAALILAANHSGDSDSTAAIAGNIVGALLGPRVMPERWLERLELRDEIERLAADLAVGYEASPEWRRRYPADGEAEPVASEPEEQPCPEGRNELGDEWDGVCDASLYSEHVLEERNAISDAARDYEWDRMLTLLNAAPGYVNLPRPGGSSRIAPLHQAAHGGAPIEVVDALIGLGAWRMLRNAGGELPVDVARRRGNTHLLERLEPVPVREVPQDVLLRLRDRFHDLIRERIRVIEPLPSLRLPELEPALELPLGCRIWFPVPGMVGGFAYHFTGEGAGARLVVDNWCRVVAGSEERHVITADRAIRVEPDGGSATALAVRLGQPQHHGGLTLFPLLPIEEGADGDAAPWVLLEEALEDGAVEVTEVDGGIVGELLAANQGPAPVLISGWRAVDRRQTESHHQQDGSAGRTRERSGSGPGERHWKTAPRRRAFSHGADRTPLRTRAGLLHRDYVCADPWSRRFHPRAGEWCGSDAATPQREAARRRPRQPLPLRFMDVRLPMRLAFVLAAILAFWPSSLRGQEGPAGPARPLVVGETFTIESRVLGERRTINVYAPAVYADSGELRLPVLYMPDGGIGEDFLHVAGLVQISSLNGTMRPFLLVGIENTERRRDLTGPTRVAEDSAIAPRVGGSAAFRRFVRDELMPAVGERYRTTDETALLGESLAGLFVVETLFLEPELFDSYVAVEPSLWWNDGDLVRRARDRLRSWGDASVVLYLASGGPSEITESTEALAWALESSAPASVRWRYVPMPSETHGTIFHPALLAALRTLFSVRPQSGP